MEKYFITKESLPEIISDLTAAILKNATKIALRLDLARSSEGEDELIITTMRKSDMATIKTMRYTIINKVDDCYDVVEFAINEALAYVNIGSK